MESTRPPGSKRPLFAMLAAFAWLAALFVFVLPASPPHAVAVACDPGRPHDAGTFDLSIESGGVSRDYLLHVPASYTGDETVPLVLNFHGLGPNATDQANLSNLPAKADVEGFIVVGSQGLGSTLIPTAHWNVVLAPTSIGEADDLGFVIDLLDALEAELCIDPEHVFVAGMSNGAEMASRLACSLSHRIAAVAPVAGVYFPPLSAEIPEAPGCPDTAGPVSIIAFHGDADTIVPFNGGMGDLEGIQLTFRDIDDVIMPEWAANNGCRTTPEEQQVTEHVRLLRYPGCDQGAGLELYVVAGGRHQWPGAEDFPQPDAADEISATDLMWDFFQAHPLVEAPPATATPAPANEGIAAPSTGRGGSSDFPNAALWAVGGLAAALMATTSLTHLCAKRAR